MNSKQLICAALALGVLAPAIGGAAGALSDDTPGYAAVAPSPAQDAAEPDADYVFGLIDSDRDGRIDRPEASASAPLTKYFGDIDTDADGLITRGEWGAYFRPGSGRA